MYTLVAFLSTVPWFQIAHSPPPPFGGQGRIPWAKPRLAGGHVSETAALWGIGAGGKSWQCSGRNGGRVCDNCPSLTSQNVISHRLGMSNAYNFLPRTPSIAHIQKYQQAYRIGFLRRDGNPPSGPCALTPWPSSGQGTLTSGTCSNVCPCIRTPTNRAQRKHGSYSLETRLHKT